MYYVYVLSSINFDKRYTGFTQDLEKRLNQHNTGKTKSTRAFKPWKVLFFEQYETKVEALQREKYLKSGIVREYINNKWPRGATE